MALGWLVTVPAGLLVNLPIRAAYDALTGSPVAPSKFTAGLVSVSLVSWFLAYLFGGYVAGRFARRAGGLNGALTAILGAVAGAALAASGVAVYGGLLVDLIGLGPGMLTVSVALALFFTYLFGGYVGGKLGEPSEPGVRRPDK